MAAKLLATEGLGAGEIVSMLAKMGTDGEREREAKASRQTDAGAVWDRALANMKGN